MHEVGEDRSTLLLLIVQSEFPQVVAKRRLTGYLIQLSGDRVYRLVHRGHPNQSSEQVRLGERTLDWDGQVLIQCRDSRSATFFRFEVATLSVGRPLPLVKRHEGTPATHIDLSLLCAFSGGGAQLASLKLAKYWVPKRDQPPLVHEK